MSDNYNDIFFSYITKDGADITLNDIKNEFFDKNLSIFEPNCDYEEYNSDLEKMAYKCNIKIKLPLILNRI